ncbi:type IV pilus modification protein PilV [Psychrobacter sp. 2Y5]|uniref:type IV pilus modification protein PilV n=1 Tax=unclassified Psychrobacter TaxID=196806 RepID=UPI003F473FE1
MSGFTLQRGIGLVEVMVALLLLAVAVLGFSAMQLSAVKATDESLMRTQSISAIKSLSESMRILPDSSLLYKKQVNDIYKSSSSSDNFVSTYCTKANSYAASAKNCNTDNCTAEEMVKYNVGAIIKSTCTKDIVLNIETCPNTSGVNQRQCIVAGWNQTKPTMIDSDFSCTNASGSYKPASSCFIMEAY